MTYSVKTIREAGLEARWTRTSLNAPIIAARRPGEKWYVIDRRMWDCMKTEGIKSAFERFTLLGDFFFIPA